MTKSGNAFKNRTITTVYAYPTFDTSIRSVPTLDVSNAGSITKTVVPVAAPWTQAGGSSTNVKAQYEAKNWSGVKYAELTTTSTPTEVTFNNVVYTIDAQTDGVYAVTPKTYNASTITIPGMFDNSKVSIKSEGGDNCQYTLVFKVNKPTEDVTVKSGVNVTSLTFNPNTRQGDVANTFSVASYTEIPTYAATNCKAKLEEVTFGEGITEVAADAFKSFEKLTKVNLGSVTEVGNSAFEGTGITAIVLPRSLATIGSKSFNTEKLEKVTVSYDKETSGNGICPIPVIITTTDNETFNAATKVLVVSDGGTATRENYLAASTWAQFFDSNVTVNIKKGTETSATRLATKDEQVTAGGATTWKRYYELVDAGNTSAITSVSISGVSEGTKIPVKYVRDFSEAGVNKFQCWYVPFEYTHIADDGCTFYYIYDTKQIGEGADATTSIELKEVKLTEGKATIKANLPYVVKSPNQKVTFEAEAIQNTPLSANDGSISFTNVVNSYTFTGTYEKKVGNDATPFYSLYASDGALHPFKANGNIWAYRFYLDIAKRTGENPYGLVKFVVLDDEDATSIENVKANSLTAPMFDLMGRQITAPAKGQVYIQNGVKKLAK